MRKILYYLIPLFLIFSNLSLFYAQGYEKELDQFLYKYYKAKNIPSISAGVYHKGKVWLKAEGYADLENSVPVSTKTVYRIASVSKSITSVAVMQLFEQKKISLNDDVRKYLPWYPQKKWKFTIRQVLSHTAGIRSYRIGEFDNKTFYKNTREAIEYIAKDSLDYEPGTNFNYTTLGYNILAGIIESVTSMKFDDYIEKYIFAPCGMTSSYFEYQPEIINNRAHGYVKNVYRKFQNAPLADLSIKYAGGGIISNPDDLLKFSANLISGKLITRETLDTMLVPVRLRSGKIIDYSLGVTSGIDENGRKYFTHTGGGTGFTSQLLVYPDEQLAAVYLSNIRDRNLDYPASSIARIILDKRTIPVKIPVADRLMDIYTTGGIDTTLFVFNSIKKDSTELFILTSEEINNFGSDLLSASRYKDAIKYYRNVISDFPEESLLFMGLADAYLKDGNKGLALKNYRIASNLDPKSIYAAEMIRKIEQQ